MNMKWERLTPSKLEWISPILHRSVHVHDTVYETWSDDAFNVYYAHKEEKNYWSFYINNIWINSYKSFSDIKQIVVALNTNLRE